MSNLKLPRWMTVQEHRLNRTQMQNDHRRGTHYWHSIIKSSWRMIITDPNRPEGFHFPLSLPCNDSANRELRWIECQVQEKRVFFLMLLDTNQWHSMISYRSINDRGTLQYTSCEGSALSLAVYLNCGGNRRFIICQNWLWHRDASPKRPLKASENSVLEKNEYIAIIGAWVYNWTCNKFLVCRWQWITVQVWAIRTASWDAFESD